MPFAMTSPTPSPGCGKRAALTDANPQSGLIRVQIEIDLGKLRSRAGRDGDAVQEHLALIDAPVVADAPAAMKAAMLALLGEDLVRLEAFRTGRQDLRPGLGTGGGEPGGDRPGLCRQGADVLRRRGAGTGAYRRCARRREPGQNRTLGRHRRAGRTEPGHPDAGRRPACPDTPRRRAATARLCRPTATNWRWRTRPATRDRRVRPGRRSPSCSSGWASTKRPMQAVSPGWTCWDPTAPGGRAPTC